MAEWISAFLREDFVSAARMAEAKTTVVAPGQPITYGLGLMKKTFLGLEAFVVVDDAVAWIGEPDMAQAIYN